MTLWQWMNIHPYRYCFLFFTILFALSCVGVYVVSLIRNPAYTLNETKKVLKTIIFVITRIIAIGFEKIAITMEKVADFMEGGEYDE